MYLFKSVCLPVNFGKARYVSLQHLRKDLNVKVLLHTVLRAEVLQDSGDVRQENIIQGAALSCKKKKKKRLPLKKHYMQRCKMVRTH